MPGARGGQAEQGGVPDEFGWKAGDGELSTVKASFRQPSISAAFLHSLMNDSGPFCWTGNRCWLPEGPGLPGRREAGRRRQLLPPKTRYLLIY